MADDSNAPKSISHSDTEKGIIKKTWYAEHAEVSLPPTQSLARKLRVALLVVAGSSLCLLWLLNDCLPVTSWKIQEEHSNAASVSAFDLVKYQVSSAAPSATGVLECFQVYQPVLTPEGITDDTVLSDGEQETTTIAPSAAEESCGVRLMQHDFAFSYGMPFIGM